MKIAASIVRVMLVLWLVISGCGTVEQERKIEFIYLALGGSDAIGVGAAPLTEGYVFLINHDLEQRISGTFLLNVGVPGARIEAVNEEVLLLKHSGGRADIATLWVGPNDLVDGRAPSQFQSDLRLLLRRLQTSISTIVVIANLPDLTRLPHFGATPHSAVTVERINAFNRAIDVEAPYVNASIVDVSEESAAEYFAFDGDGFHPTQAGHRHMANLFRKVILERLGFR